MLLKYTFSPYLSLVLAFLLHLNVSDDEANFTPENNLNKTKKVVFKWFFAHPSLIARPVESTYYSS